MNCANCMRPSIKNVDVPDVDDAPQDVDEFIESAAFMNVRFFCRHCEGMIGAVVAVTLEGDKPARSERGQRVA